MFSDDRPPRTYRGAVGNKRVALLVAAALVAAVLGFSGAGSGVAQTNADAVTFSGTVTAAGGASTENVMVTVGALCWDSCGIEALPDDQPERPRPLGPVEYFGQTSVDTSGTWSVTVSGVLAENVRSVLVVVWDTNGELATRIIDSGTLYELRHWESLSDIDVELEVGGRVSGRFEDSAGGPPPTGGYALMMNDWPRAIYALDVDPQNGAFISPVVTPGEYRIAHGDHSNGYLANNDAARVNITTGQTADAGTVHVQQSGQITGIVTDSAGRPLSNITVSGRVTSQNRYRSMPPGPFNPSAITGFDTTTADDGTYTADNIAPGSDWRVQFEDPTGTFPPQKYADANANRTIAATAIAVSETHSCAIKTDRTIVCWGDNTYGRTDAPDGQYTAIATNFLHSCAIKTDQTIECWSENVSGQAVVSPHGQFTAIAAGGYHSCAIKTDQAIKCWFPDHFYEDNSDFDQGQAEAPGGEYAAIAATAIAAGTSHSCAIATDNTITCWGDNTYGQTDAPDGQHAAIAAGTSHSCAIATDNTITCWGDNTYGQTDAPYGQYTAIAAGTSHSCAIATDNTITCWGADAHSQADPPDGQYTAIAAGTSNTCAIKTDSTITCWTVNAWGLVDAPDGQYTAIAAGFFHSCAIRTDSTVACWGDNTDGQTDAPSGQYTAIATGFFHSCAIATDSTIACWGDNTDGQTDAPSGQYTAIATGLLHSCAIKTDNTIACWGLGDSTPQGQFAAIATSFLHSCAIRTNGTIVCWDDDGYERADSPDGHYTAIAAGTSHSCAIATDNTIACWGDNKFGRANAPDGQFVAIAADWRHSCAIKTDGTTACWGDNAYGQTNAPDGHYTAIAAGQSHTCAIKTDGTIECWGIGSSGSHPATSPSSGIFSFVTVEPGQTTTGIDAQIPTAETSDETAPEETTPEEDDTAQRCFDHHKFGAQPVDVAKSADRQTVLAQVRWGFHETIGCYLTLDPAALQTLRAAPAPLGFPAGDPSAARQCSAVHKFGAQPVDVAKSADRQTVLAQVRWGFHETIGCYLTLDPAAIAALRAAHT
ncbi:hypothetical protein [Candidatus Poriferisocius sp.]|uniref:hypothetical protein n=1 Tax=Candidatus Poriferisocius sp. TaxID=3101276 RepID=UPI003B0161E8